MSVLCEDWPQKFTNITQPKLPPDQASMEHQAAVRVVAQAAATVEVAEEAAEATTHPQSLMDALAEVQVVALVAAAEAPIKAVLRTILANR